MKLIHAIKSAAASLGALAVLALSTPDCTADPGITDSTITLGMSAPFSGPNGAYGAEMKVGRVIVNSPSSQGAIGDIYNTKIGRAHV